MDIMPVGAGSYISNFKLLTACKLLSNANLYYVERQRLLSGTRTRSLDKLSILCYNG